MEKRGSDPEADLTCWAKRVDHVASCMRRLGKGTDAKTLTKGLAECHDSAAAVCPLSPLFEQQAKACQKAAAGTEGSTW
jgi:hypothetical protein